MLNPSKSDCITILSAASELADDSMLALDASRLGLSRNGMQAAVCFLIERGVHVWQEIASLRPMDQQYKLTRLRREYPSTRCRYLPAIGKPGWRNLMQA